MDSPASGGADARWALEMAEMCAELQPTTSVRFLFVNNSSAGGLNPGMRQRLERAGIPYLSGLRPALGALGQWLAHGRDGPRRGAHAEGRSPGALAGDAASRSQPEQFRLLREAGVPMVECIAVHSPEQAVEVARKLGVPVALKAAGPGVPHKSDFGLVRLSLAEPVAVQGAFGELADRVRAFGLVADIVLQPMAAPGLELILGARHELGFGTVVAVGLGGTYVELMDQASVRLAPIGRDEALEMLDDPPLGRLLAGFRGKGPYDAGAAADAVVAFAAFAATTAGAFAALEVNPLIVLERGRGAVGVDLLLEPAASLFDQSTPMRRTP